LYELFVKVTLWKPLEAVKITKKAPSVSAYFQSAPTDFEKRNYEKERSDSPFIQNTDF